MTRIALLVELQLITRLATFHALVGHTSTGNALPITFCSHAPAGTLLLDTPQLTPRLLDTAVGSATADYATVDCATVSHVTDSTTASRNTSSHASAGYSCHASELLT